MKRRSFIALLGALTGVGFLPKAASKPLTFMNGQPVGPPPPPSIPVGTVSSFAGKNIPAGWLPCDGRTLSPTEFPKLCEILGPPFKVIKLTPQPLMHAVPDNPDHEDLCGWHGEPKIELLDYSYIVKAK